MGSLTANWSWDPSLIYVTVAGLMYVLGGLRRVPPEQLSVLGARLREIAFGRVC